MALTSSCTFHTTTQPKHGSNTLGINGPDSRKESSRLIQWLSLHRAKKYFQEIGSPHEIVFIDIYNLIIYLLFSIFPAFISFFFV